MCSISLQAASPEIEKARQYGAKGQVTFRITDSTGKLVEHAKVNAGFFNQHKRGQVAEGQTDTNGCFVVTGFPAEDMNYTITKDGYYKTEGRYWFYRPESPCLKDGCWQPWNPTNTVILKEHRNPVSMYAKHIDTHIPVQRSRIGFDFEKGDWVAPHGQGVRADLLLEYEAKYEEPQVYSKHISITFSHDMDGLQSFTLDRTSELMSPYTAPEVCYLPTLLLERERTRTKIIKSQDVGKDQYLVFRVRTLKDKDGKIISTNYGKMYGPIEYGRMGEEHRLIFNYYFNSTANDRNLEFDPGHNLFSNTNVSRVYMP